MQKVSSTISQYKEELYREINGLPDEMLKEILDFTYYIKVKDSIDPSQVYFWTKKWQNMEREADKDKEEDNTIGDGTLSGLLKELNK